MGKKEPLRVEGSFVSISGTYCRTRSQAQSVPLLQLSRFDLLHDFSEAVHRVLCKFGLVKVVVGHA